MKVSLHSIFRERPIGCIRQDPGSNWKDPMEIYKRVVQCHT
jgi:hypothetical protein